MEAGLLQETVQASSHSNVQFKSNILVPFSAQKLSNCLAAVDNSSPKGFIKIYCLFCKIPIFTEPCLGVSLWFFTSPLRKTRMLV